MITMADRKAAAAGEEEQFLERVENPDPNDVSWCISALVERSTFLLPVC